MTTVGLIRELKAMGACEELKPDFTFDEVCEMITTHRGASFCVEANAPSLASWREPRLRRNKDVGDVVRIDELVYETNAKRSVLVKCSGELRFEQNTAYYVYLLHGSKMKIVATGFALVHVFKSADSRVKIEKSDEARVIV